jgi:hypothetical protein
MAMGHKIYIAYEEANHPQTRLGEFCEGVFAGTLGFMTTVGGWLVSLFCWLGLETQSSAALALAISVGIGVTLGLSFARDGHNQREERCETK